MDRREMGAWAGILGPSLFIATFTVEGWLRPGYEARKMFISALSLGPRGWIQVVNFIILGVLFLAFAQGIAAAFPEGKASHAGPILLVIIGTGFLAAGPCVMDPVNTPRDQMTFHGMLHGISGALVFSLSPVSCFVFLRRFRDDPAWRSLQRWTRTAGAIVVAFVVLLSLATKPPFAPNALSNWVGIIQRTALVTYLAWIFTFALALRRRSRQSPPAI